MAADRVIEMTLITGRPEAGARSGAFMGEGGPQSQPSQPSNWDTFAGSGDLCSKVTSLAARFLFCRVFFTRTGPHFARKRCVKLPIFRSRDTSLT
ncbi:hypothetical protein J2R96_007563 [Bradyrhizobium elkanii]|nr:hypothetical protein [Bradyrhizobium elkanii]